MSAPKAPLPSCPLPISTTQLARGLIRLHARLRGELAKARDDEELLVDGETAAAMLKHLDAVIAFLGVDFAPSAVRPIRTRPKIGPMGYGDLRAEILAALRAKGAWMAYTDIAQAVIAKRSLNLTPAQRRHFLQKLREATHVLAGQGAVEREHAIRPAEFNAKQRWRLSQRLFRSR